MMLDRWTVTHRHGTQRIIWRTGSGERIGLPVQQLLVLLFR